MVRFLSGSKKMECHEAKPHRRWGAKWLNYVWWVSLGREHSESSSKGGKLLSNKIGKKSLGHRKQLVQMFLRGNLLRYRSTVRSSWEA